MNINEKAKEYAGGKALAEMSAIIEQAYTDGFKAGREALEAEWKKKVINGVEYVDLGLPNGTLWSSHLLQNDKNELVHLVYDDAAKLNIPTMEQFKELKGNCEISAILDKGKPIGVTFIGRNGKTIDVFFGYTLHGKDIWPNVNYKFWLRDDDSIDNERICAFFKEARSFMGNRLPVMLVLTPEEKK